MGFLSGVISDRLRKAFSPSDTVWTPQRPKESTPMPKKGVKGVALGGRPGRKKK
jgi:hypothetical protein